MIPYGSLVVYIPPRGRRYVKVLLADDPWQSTHGVLNPSIVASSGFGSVVHTSTGVPIRVEEATLMDRIMGLKRQTQIIYPKDIAYICMRLGVGPGRHIMEAGCGSGALTLAFSWFCGPTGHVTTHDAREEFVRLCKRNLAWAQAIDNVQVWHRDIAEGFAGSGADALFLDVREPWLYLPQIAQAVRPGASIAFLLPTTAQVEHLLSGLEKAPFGQVEVLELFLRSWKPLADRLRPCDRMNAHTGFLVFCRQQQPSGEYESYLPKGTRERKQHAALQARLAAG